MQNATSQKTELSASLTPLAPRPLRARYIFARSKHLGKSVKEPGKMFTHQKDKNSLRLQVSGARKQGCFGRFLVGRARLHRLPTEGGWPTDGWMDEWMKRAPRPGITSFTGLVPSVLRSTVDARRVLQDAPYAIHYCTMRVAALF